MPRTVTIGGQTLRARRAKSRFQRLRGHMFRRYPPDYALVFPGDGVERWSLHMLFVPFALDALFVVDGVVEVVAELAPWTGTAIAEAEEVIEVPHGIVDVEKGMEVSY